MSTLPAVREPLSVTSMREHPWRRGQWETLLASPHCLLWLLVGQEAKEAFEDGTIIPVLENRTVWFNPVLPDIAVVCLVVNESPRVPSL